MKKKYNLFVNSKLILVLLQDSLKKKSHTKANKEIQHRNLQFTILIDLSAYGVLCRFFRVSYIKHIFEHE